MDTEYVHYRFARGLRWLALAAVAGLVLLLLTVGMMIVILNTGSVAKFLGKLLQISASRSRS